MATIQEKVVLEKIPEPGNPEANPTPERMPPLQNPLPSVGGVSTVEKRGPGRPPGSTNKPKEPTPKTPTPKAKDGPPSFMEWQDFIGSVVLHWLSKAFVTVALRGIDRKLLDPIDKDDIELDDDELTAIAAPFSNLIIQSKGFNSKWGRNIINLKDVIEASVILFMFGSRVYSVRKRYAPKHAKNERSAPNVTPIKRPAERVTNSEQKAEETPNPPRGIPAGFGYAVPGAGYN